MAFSPIAIAHQPIFAIDGIHSRDQPFEIEQPEVSKAIYSELTGEPHFYRITSNKRFNFYAGLTKPKLDNCPVGYTFSLDVLAENFNIITNVDGGNFEWWPWYESFGRKWYWVGPEVGANFRHTRALAAGTYYIRVYNLLNRGHYVLAVGDIESFPVGVMTRMLRDLPKINRKFWKEAKCSS
ncbi:MAG: hypothetical protein QF535_21760 [Anaerolineales bacterium]|nr:hypothetical protein [Anaerolineales bacterium]